MEGWFRRRLDRFNTCKSVGPNGMHPWVLKELADDASKPLANITEKSWQTGEVPDAWRKGNATPIFKNNKEDPGSNQPVNLTSIPGRVIEQVVLEIITKHVEEKKVIRSSQHGFTKWKPCLTNLTAFYDGMGGLEGGMGGMAWEGQWSAVDVVYLCFGEILILSTIASS